MKNLKIGITIAIRSIDEALWINGIKLNILILVKLLKNSKNNYQVCLLNSTDVDLSEKRPNYLEDVDVFKFKEKYTEMDLIITMGTQVHEEYLKHFKSLGNKRVVSYRCGNNYIITAENVMFKDGSGDSATYQVEKEFDELWYIPQQHETNCGYYKTIYRANSMIVPFIWHQKYILESLISIEKNFRSGNGKKGFQYEPKEKKVLGVMEPNINIVKFCLIPLLVAEEAYRTETGKKHIEKIMLTNAEKVKEHREFMGIVRTLDMYKDGIIRAESRYQTAYILTQYIDVLICHQLLNPLNYLYLDAVYMGYPVLHNAWMVKDLAYYYEGSDTEDGAKQLNEILLNHDNNLDEYRESNKKVLWRYSADNARLVEEYDMLIYNLFNGGNHGLEYDYQTNLYKKR